MRPPPLRTLMPERLALPAPLRPSPSNLSSSRLGVRSSHSGMGALASDRPWRPEARPIGPLGWADAMPVIAGPARARADADGPGRCAGRLRRALPCLIVLPSHQRNLPEPALVVADSCVRVGLASLDPVDVHALFRFKVRTFQAPQLLSRLCLFFPSSNPRSWGPAPLSIRLRQSTLGNSGVNSPCDLHS